MADQDVDHGWRLAMAKMCPMSGCKSHSGFCVHDMMMIGMGVMLMVAAGAHWGLHLF